jgi:hypothetical protein
MTHLLYLLLPALIGLSSPDTTRYDVHYKLGAIDTRVVTAEITWEKSVWEEIPAWYSAAVLRTTPFFRMFLGKDYFSESYFSQSEMKPLYFDNPYKNGRDEYIYRNETGEIESTITHKGRTEYATFPLDGRTMDFLTLVHFIRFLDLSLATEPMPMHILITGKSYPAEILHLGEDTDKFPDTPVDKILVRLTERGLMENGSGNEIYLWRSRSDDRTLLRLETVLGSGFMYAKIANFAR